MASKTDEHSMPNILIHFWSILFCWLDAMHMTLGIMNASLAFGALAKPHIKMAKVKSLKTQDQFNYGPILNTGRILHPYK